MDRETITWSVTTHEHRDHSPDWYWTLGILTLVGIGASIYFMDLLLAIILSIGVASIFILSLRGPREHDVTVSAHGINLDGTLYRYPSIHSFWVSIEHPEVEDLDPRARLFLSTKGYLHPRVMIPLNDVSHAEEVREYLLKYLEEREQGPHFAEHLAELLGV